MMYYNTDFGFGWIFMVIFWVLVIWAFISLLRWPKGHHCSHCGHQGAQGGSHSGHQHGPHHAFRHSALDLLQERYVKGEIAKAEYLEKRKDLTD